MKIIKGILKSFFPENSFADVIFEDDSDDKNYYIQILDNGKIIFAAYEKDGSDIFPISYSRRKNIGKKLIYSFVKNDDSVLIGTIDDIKEDLIEILEDENVLPMAKIEIANELKFWGLANKCYNKSLDYLKTRRNNINFMYSSDTEDNIVVDDDTIDVFISKIIESHKAIIEKEKNNICWKDTIVLKDSVNVISFGNIDTTAELFVKKVKALKEDELLREVIEVGAPIKSFNIENKTLSEENVLDGNGTNIKEIAKFIKNRQYEKL
jgi:hypothetical protein